MPSRQTARLSGDKAVCCEPNSLLESNFPSADTLLEGHEVGFRLCPEQRQPRVPAITYGQFFLRVDVQFEELGSGANVLSNRHVNVREGRPRRCHFPLAGRSNPCRGESAFAASSA